MPDKTYTGKGLLPLPPDPRDFSHAKVFGSIYPENLPADDFMVSPSIWMKNQDINYPSDFCSSYGASEVASDEDNIDFLPEWLFMQAKAIVARTDPNAYREYGLNLRQICEAGRQKGFLPVMYDPFGCQTANRPARNFLVDPNNWARFLLDARAAPYIKPSYFAVDGPYDTFDNFRSALWLNRAFKRSILTGALWRESWSEAKDGIIPDSYESTGSAHAFKICGQMVVGEDLRLVAQLSDGPEFGDKGFFYFTRAQANAELGKYGAYMFQQLNPATAQMYLASKVTVHDSVLLKLLKLIFTKI